MPVIFIAMFCGAAIPDSGVIGSDESAESDVVVLQENKNSDITVMNKNLIIG